MRRFTLVLYLGLVVLATIPAGSRAEEPHPALVLGERVGIRSQILGEDREILVYLPNGYQESDARYPLFVFTDARPNFKATTGVIHSLSEARAIPRMIAVGIVNTDRWRDLTPMAGMGIPGTGGGAGFLRFVAEELLPFVDERWRTNGFRVFQGHSLGGLTALNFLKSSPDLFDAYLALSPSLEWADGELIDQFERFLDSRERNDVMLYLALADEQMERPYFDRMVRLLEAKSPLGLEWTAGLFEDDDDHGTIRVTGGLAGTRWVFRDWRLSSKRIYAMTDEQITAHYARASQRYGEPLQMGMMQMTDAAYWGLYDEARRPRAMQLFHRAIELWPDLAYPYSCLGEALERTGDLEGALVQMEKALTMAKEAKHFDIPYFQGMVDRVRAALAPVE